MQRIEIWQGTPLVEGSTVPTMLSIEGGDCRLYMGAVPGTPDIGHLVGTGYQIIVPAGLDVFATAASTAPVAIVGPFGV